MLYHTVQIAPELYQTTPQNNTLYIISNEIVYHRNTQKKCLVVLLSYWCLFTELCYNTEEKSWFLLEHIKECEFSVTLQWLLFKMTCTVLYAQFCMS